MLGFETVALLTVLLSGAAEVGTPDRAEITGRVLSRDGEPLAGVEVVLVDRGRGTLTGGDGRFALRDLPTGRHRLQFSRIGYAPVVREVEVGEAATEVELAVTMDATPLSLAGVRVTATPSAREAVRGTQSVTQLQGRALERSLGGTVAETLQNEPGIGVRYNGPGAAAPIVRGLTGDRVLVLQDGQRAADLSGSADDHGVTIDPLSARSIEVVRGPSALMYGNNAIGGVVNVLTDEPPSVVPRRPDLRIAVQAESVTPGGAATFRAAVPVAESWVVTIRGNARRLGDVRVGSDRGRLANTDRGSEEVSASAGYLRGLLTAGAAAREYRFAYGLPLPPGETNDVRLEGRMTAIKATARAPIRSGFLTGFSAAASLQDYTHEELTHGRVDMAFGLRTDAADLVLSQAPVGALSEGAWGISWSRRQYEATGKEQLTAPAISRSIGLFSFQELALGEERGAVQLGFRFDHYLIDSQEDPHFGPGISRDFTAISGSLGANSEIVDGVVVAASVARGFRSPTVEELFSDALHLGVAAYEIGDPNLAPEHATGVDLLARIRRPGFTAEVAVYHMRIDDYVLLQTLGDTVIGGTTWPVVTYVQDAAELRGLDAKGEWLLRGGLVAELTADIVRGSRVDGPPLPFMPAARVGGTLRWERGPFSLGASARHSFAQDRITVEDGSPTAAFTLYGIGMGIDITRGVSRHSVTLRAENLTDHAYRDATSRIKSFAPGPGRNLKVLYSVSL